MHNQEQSAGSCAASKALSLLHHTSSAQSLTHKCSFILQASLPCSEQRRRVATISSVSYRNYECHGLQESRKIWRVPGIIKSKLLIKMMAELFATILMRLRLVSITRQVITHLWNENKFLLWFKSYTKQTRILLVWNNVPYRWYFLVLPSSRSQAFTELLPTYFKDELCIFNLSSSKQPGHCCPTSYSGADWRYCGYTFVYISGIKRKSNSYCSPSFFPKCSSA